MSSACFRLLAGSLLVVLSTALVAAPDTVRLSADPWMPYNGTPGDERPGYVVEFAREIFSAAGIQVEYTVMPWEKALTAARAGEVDGAICANREEGAELVIEGEHVGAPKMIIVTRPDSDWTLRNVSSLRQIRLGVIAEYSYWPMMDSYIEKAEADAVYVASGEAPLDDLIAKLDAGEIDAFVESEAVFAWKLRELNRSRDTIKVVYRHFPDEVFIAFSPDDKGRRFARIFSEGLAKLKAEGRADIIARRYGLLSWQ